MNATLRKFEDPLTRIKAYQKWILLLRPQQVTVGSMVLVCVEPATAFSMVSREAVIELHGIVNEVERHLRRIFAYDKINYLMLMMVDPDVHLHVVPRYAGHRMFGNRAFVDYSWPGPPDLSRVNATSAEEFHAILAHLRREWA